MKNEITQFEKKLEAQEFEPKPKQECEHNWKLFKQRPVHWYSWHNNLLCFYCKKCLNTANLILNTANLINKDRK